MDFILSPRRWHWVVVVRMTGFSTPDVMKNSIRAKSLIGRLERCRRRVVYPLISNRWVVLYLKLAWSGTDQVIEKEVAR